VGNVDPALLALAQEYHWYVKRGSGDAVHVPESVEIVESRRIPLSVRTGLTVFTGV
jgi:hypothetical protein